MSIKKVAENEALQALNRLKTAAAELNKIKASMGAPVTKFWDDYTLLEAYITGAAPNEEPEGFIKGHKVSPRTCVPVFWELKGGEPRDHQQRVLFSFFLWQAVLGGGFISYDLIKNRLGIKTNRILHAQVCMLSRYLERQGVQLKPYLKVRFNEGWYVSDKLLLKNLD